MYSSDADGRNTLRDVIPSSPSTVLTSDDIVQALAGSEDNGATLDLARKGLTDVGEAGAEELANIIQETDSAVVRIALAYNRLTTLPMAFALLSRLRYLVLRNNNFSTFPNVLTVMPSLEILDISRNKIKRLPSQPGSLTNLRVFSLLRNKIRRLPAYISQFQQLSILKVDQNPIEWPPKSILQSHDDLHDPQVMGEWIKGLQAWMDENHSSPTARKMSEDSIESEFSRDMSNVSTEQTDASAPPSPPPLPPKDGFHATALYHARSFSLESDTSSYFQLERSRSDLTPSHDVRPGWPSSMRFTPSAAGFLPAASESLPPSPDSYYPSNGSGTPSEHAGSRNSSKYRPVQAQDEVEALEDDKSRNSVSNLTVKKSLPELRLTNLHLTTRRDDLPSQRSGVQNGTPSPPKQSSISENSSPIALDRSVPAMDKERHAYFRRFSALTPLNLAKTIPEDLLALVDAIRGILFGVSQIYQTLHHYTVYAIDARLSAVLLKVLDPAAYYMSQLIGALDRFDSMSKRAVPSPAVSRTVVEYCRDTITVFGKAVGVLTLQLKVLATHDDVRYTRQMLLTLYGAMAEIASSWQAIASRIDSVKPLLWESRPPPASKSFTAQVSRTHGSESSRSPVSAPAGGPSTFHPSSDHPRLRPNVSPSSLDHGKTRMARRHAGSFSSKDVEIGKMLPSYVDPPSFAVGFFDGAAPPTPVPRSARRTGPSLGSAPLNVTSMANVSGPYSADGSHSTHRWDAHSRQGSQSSLLPSSSSSLALRAAQFDTPINSSTLMDKEAIDAMKQALDAAPAIWEMVCGILSEEDENNEPLKEILSRAQEVAERLRKSVTAIQDGSPLTDRRPLHDDARMFAKTVIQLSGAIKTHIAAHPLSSTVRTNMVKLTNATEEFVILLHVSSFSPAPTPRPYTPLVGPQPSPLSHPDDGKLGANLSRARSAAHSASSKLAPAMRDPPHSALPHSTFTVPTPPRSVMLRKETMNDMTAVPG